MSKLENKAMADGSATGVAESFDDFMRAFEAFKETNDERLAQIESRVSSDVVTEEKLARINTALDSLALKSNRPHLSGKPASATGLQHKAAFEGYVRSGETSGLRQLEAKSLSAGSDPDGG